jgi:hypothetical protein
VLVGRQLSDSERSSREYRTKLNDNEQSSGGARMKRPPQERASNGKAEHSMDRIEACSIKIATIRTEDLVRRKEDQGMDKMGVDRTVARYFARLVFRTGKT